MGKLSPGRGKGLYSMHLEVLSQNRMGLFEEVQRKLCLRCQGLFLPSVVPTSFKFKVLWGTWGVSQVLPAQCLLAKHYL